jgi:hypothetical protein
MFLLASLLLPTFLMLLATYIKSWLVSMLFLVHLVAAGFPAVTDAPAVVLCFCFRHFKLYNFRLLPTIFPAIFCLLLSIYFTR